MPLEIQPHSYRDSWNVLVPAQTLLSAAYRQRDYHEGRRDHWKQTLEKSEAKLRTEGVIFAEEQAVYSNSQHGIRFDQGLVQEHQFARTKVEEHEGKRRKLHAYCLILEVAAERDESLAVTAEDAEFFHL